MASLDTSFEQSFEDAILEDIVATFTRDGGPLDQAVERSHEVLISYGQEHDYDVGPIIEALSEPAVYQNADSVKAYWGWHHPAAPYFEFGTSDHVVDGDPVLSFVWEDPPEWIREEFDREGDGWRVFLPETEPSGLPASRFMRQGLRHLRRQLEA